MIRLIASLLVIFIAFPAFAGTRIWDAPELPSYTGNEKIPIDNNTPSALAITIKKLRRSDNGVAAGTCSGSYNVNPANGGQMTLTLNGACTIGVTGLAPFDSFILYLTQAGTTAPTFTAAFKWSGGTAPNWSTTAGKYDLLTCGSPDGVKLICSPLIDAR
jgi:hypothetical protein